jgi:hypothetical protein
VADCSSSGMRPDRGLGSSMGTEWSADRNPSPFESSSEDTDRASDKLLDQFGSTSVDGN